MQFGGAGKDELQEVAMLIAVFMATRCALGLAFYARFLFALCKECRHKRICYLVRLQTHSLERAAREGQVLYLSVPRAA